MATAETGSTTRSRKIVLSVILVAVLGSVAGFAVYSAFSSETTTAANSFTAGTVDIGANDAGAALYSLANQKPGSTSTSCIKVTYTGSLDSDVKLFTPDTIGALGPFVDLTITPGSQASSTYPDCTGFTADGDAIFSGTLAEFAEKHNSWRNGVVDNPGASSRWVTGDSVVYRFVLALQDDNDAQGLTTGSHRFTFEARNR